MRRGSQEIRAGVLACAVLIAVACGKAQVQPAKSWPAGTVLALDGQPILESEVDEAAGMIALLEPRDSIVQLRRLALTNIVLPRCAARAIDPAARDEALRLATQWRTTLDKGLDPAAPAPGPQMLEKQGRILDLGIELWTAAFQSEDGHWTPILETAGCFHIARVQERSTAQLPGQVELTIQSYDFPYVPKDQARAQIDAQLDRSKLEYVDESWRELVPTAWQYRFRRGAP
ncbi:MAG: peptidyl-prolyl cis-trans isomerase [Planctomycetes bacterium]|nr:peptidyl-prolyl cis-trans isomerase [Planctomycetota bacterium]